MKMFGHWEDFIAGVVLTSLCVLGLLGNLVTLLVLNSNREMRNQPINFYLTVLSLFDNGVLFNAILMVSLPSLCKLLDISVSAKVASPSLPIISPSPSLDVEDLSERRLLSEEEIASIATAIASDPQAWQQLVSYRSKQDEEAEEGKLLLPAISVFPLSEAEDTNQTAQLPSYLASLLARLPSSTTPSSPTVQNKKDISSTILPASDSQLGGESSSTLVVPTLFVRTSQSPRPSLLTSHSNSIPSSSSSQPSPRVSWISSLSSQRGDTIRTHSKRSHLESPSSATIEAEGSVLTPSLVASQFRQQQEVSTSTSMLFLPSEDEGNKKGSFSSRETPSVLDSTSTVSLQYPSHPSFVTMTSTSAFMSPLSPTTSTHAQSHNNHAESSLVSLQSIPSLFVPLLSSSPASSLPLLRKGESHTDKLESHKEIFSMRHRRSVYEHLLPDKRNNSEEEKEETTYYYSRSSSSTKEEDKGKKQDSLSVHSASSQAVAEESFQSLSSSTFSPNFLSSHSLPTNSYTSHVMSKTKEATIPHAFSANSPSQITPLSRQEISDQIPDPVISSATPHFEIPATSLRLSSSSPVYSSSSPLFTSKNSMVLTSSLSDIAPEYAVESESTGSLRVSRTTHSMTANTPAPIERSQEYTDNEEEINGPEFGLEQEEKVSSFRSSRTERSKHHLYQNSSIPDELDPEGEEESIAGTDEDDPRHFYITFIYPLALISQTGSVWTTCLITAERYFAIAHPLRALTLSTKKRAFWSCLVMTIIAVLYNVPRFFEVTIVRNEHDKPIIRPADFRYDALYYWAYHVCVYFLLLYIVPLSLLITLNYYLYVAIKKATRDRSSLTRHQESELNIASMLVILVAVFCACNLPAFVVNIFEVFRPPYLSQIILFSNFLVCFNSSINFVIYCTFGKKFRERLVHTFCCVSGRVPRRSTPIKIRNHNNDHKASIVAETIV